MLFLYNNVCVQAQLLDKAAGAYVRFRLGGVRFANLYKHARRIIFITDSISS